jgi:hypothetical protein
MADDKEPMQAGGTNGVGRAIANENEPPSDARPDMDHNEGQSGGGAYPNPHNDPANADPEGGFMGHGGQSDIDYHGGGEPVEDEGIPERHNAVTEDED